MKTSNHIHYIITAFPSVVISELVVAPSDTQNATHMTTKGTMDGKEGDRREWESSKGRVRGRKRERHKREGRLSGGEAMIHAPPLQQSALTDPADENQPCWRLIWHHIYHKYFSLQKIVPWIIVNPPEIRPQTERSFGSNCWGFNKPIFCTPDLDVGRGLGPTLAYLHIY